MNTQTLIQALVASLAFAAVAAHAAPEGVVTLPRVVITGKSAAAVAQLPRVVITGHALRDVAQLPRVVVVGSSEASLLRQQLLAKTATASTRG